MVAFNHLLVQCDTRASMLFVRAVEGARLDEAQEVRVSREAGSRKRQVCFAR